MFLRVLETAIIWSARLWTEVVDSCRETDVLDGVPREDEDEEGSVGDSIGAMIAMGFGWGGLLEVWLSLKRMLQVPLFPLSGRVPYKTSQFTLQLILEWIRPTPLFRNYACDVRPGSRGRYRVFSERPNRTDSR